MNKPCGFLSVNSSGHLEIDGGDAVRLASDYGTPLYVLSYSAIISSLDRLTASLNDNMRFCYDMGVLPSAKLISELVSKVADNNNKPLMIAVSSLDEMNLALDSGSQPENLCFYGHNKTEEELTVAIMAGVGYMVLDNLREIGLIDLICGLMGSVQKVILRVSDKLELSRLGICHNQLISAADEISCLDTVELCGVAVSADEVENLVSFIIGQQSIADSNKKLLERLIVVGADTVNFEICIAAASNMGFSEVILEASRSISIDCGAGLYRVGHIKSKDNINYIATDGSFNVNKLKPVILNIANRMVDNADTRYIIGGKSGNLLDALSESVLLPNVNLDDLLYVSSDYYESSDIIGKMQVVMIKDMDCISLIERKNPDYLKSLQSK